MRRSDSGSPCNHQIYCAGPPFRRSCLRRLHHRFQHRLCLLFGADNDGFGSSPPPRPPGFTFRNNASRTRPRLPLPLELRAPTIPALDSRQRPRVSIASESRQLSTLHVPKVAGRRSQRPGHFASAQRFNELIVIQYPNENLRAPALHAGTRPPRQTKLPHQKQTGPIIAAP